MTKNQLPNEIIPYNLPLKRELDTFQYDVATYCDCMKKVLGSVFPDYLRDFKKEVWKYASQKKLVCPGSFNNNVRIYIFDPRLRIPLIIEDTTGDIANYCSKLAKNCRGLDDYVYGDGERFDSVSLSGERNDQFIKHFNKVYGFMPFEEFAMPALAIFHKSELEERRMLSTWLVSFLLMKYYNENLVNWAEVLDDLYYCFDPIFPLVPRKIRIVSRILRKFHFHWLPLGSIFFNHLITSHAFSIYAFLNVYLASFAWSISSVRISFVLLTTLSVFCCVSTSVFMAAIFLSVSAIARSNARSKASQSLLTISSNSSFVTSTFPLIPLQ